jgi:hypothetical protein
MSEDEDLMEQLSYADAYALAITGNLPAKFDQWGLANSDGWTVAHAAAMNGPLPLNFDLWGLDNETGWTVAHEAARYGQLPDSFSQWGMSNNSRTSVLGCLRFSGQADEYLSRWEKEKPLCKTDADWSVFKAELPEVYYRYAVNEVMSDVHDEVAQGALL